ncbi:MAG TPA: class I SAM-dependent methyltransferase [Bosea sp. (in: a-proteobacteria)]|jgi:ubiquinone/menaquinone biosynthesis C-methylase UbiE|uniref:class I SAM-dependent methyltransferase n=1 Tax=Bosea sp. (in: a-proteobacteria) TaxID=1871050 RepID=UPI002E13F482|nr:class I SAM-dependent methyltransferase [Bosea sp. (in: a-proteobacteria)]
MTDMGTRPAGDTVDILAALLAPLQDRRILDIGCGRGHLLHALAERGARMAGVDPDEAALEAARALVPKAQLHKAGALHLPWGDASMHVAIFLNSLHHVPVPEMLPALEEAARVVGKGGTVIVVEPLSEGTFFDALRLIEDETEVRQAAQDAIVRAMRRGVVSEQRRIEFDRIEAFPDLAAFVARAVAADPARLEQAVAARDKLQARFETLSERDGRGHLLHQPIRLHQLKVPVGPRPVVNPALFG